MKVLITGATGFVGSHLIKKCLEKGWEVSAFVWEGDQEADWLKDLGINIFFGDVRNSSDVSDAVKGQDVVFHAAAYVSDWGAKSLFEEITVHGTENVCAAALRQGVKRLVLVSTNDVFGRREDVVTDETFPLSPWGEPYPDTKIRAEEVAWSYHKKYNLPVTMVYPCWIYGEGDKTFVPLLADAILKREMVFMRKSALVWPAYVGNVTNLLITIAEHPNAVGQGYLVHDGESDTLENFCQKIAKAYQTEMKVRYIPYWLAMLAAFVLEIIWKILGRKQRPILTTYTVKNLGSRLKFTIEKAKNDLDWEPPVSYKEGMKRTLNWLLTLDKNKLKQK